MTALFSYIKSEVVIFFMESMNVYVWGGGENSVFWISLKNIKMTTDSNQEMTTTPTENLKMKFYEFLSVKIHQTNFPVRDIKTILLFV